MNKPHFLICVILLILTSGCSKNNNDPLYGYIEGRLIYLSSPESGKLTHLFVQRGQEVKANNPIFTLEQEPQSSAVAQAIAAVNEAQANLLNLEKGQRPTEIEQIEAQLQAAIHRRTYAQQAYERRVTLVAKEFVDKETLDQDFQDLQVAIQNVAELEAKLETAKLPARSDEIQAARDRLTLAQNQLKEQEWALAKKSIQAPASGLIFDTYYRVGEEVPLNRPVAALLVPNEIKAIFYVPQPKLANLAMGQEVTIYTNDSNEGYTGKVSYLSPTAEFTPPVIYSRESRSKLVFRVELSFPKKTARTLHPGQPIEIRDTQF